MAKVLLFIADGTEEVEALTTVDILRRAGIEVTTVSIMGREEIKSSHGIRIHADELIENVVFDDKDMLILPGGKVGTDNLKANKTLADQILKFRSEGKALAAICAAPTVFASLGILKGIKSTCNIGFKDVLIEAGALYDGNAKAVTDDKIITSQAMGTSVPFGLEIVKFFEGEEKASALKADIAF
ncbi:MAG: DJ-1/PfpI family protein [Clostridiales bacterium]|nr:DJ-1/PfpI family protein [Clostridiales bacterium]